MALLGGPAEGDASDSLYSTWAIAHGHLACAYSPITTHHIPSIAQAQHLHRPFGRSSLVLLIRSYESVTTFRSHPRARSARTALPRWSRCTAGQSNPMLRCPRFVSATSAGSSSWPEWWRCCGPRDVGVVDGNRRRFCSWRVFRPCWRRCVDYFHPQDLVAMGLILGGLGVCAAGVVDLGWRFGRTRFTTQQFALLVMAPLFVVAPRGGVRISSRRYVARRCSCSCTHGRFLLRSGATASLLGTGHSSGRGEL